MTAEDLMKFAQIHRLDPEERDRLTFILLALVTNNRKRYLDDTAYSTKFFDQTTFSPTWNKERESMKLSSSVSKNMLIDFWESRELEAAFRLVDRNNNGSIGLDEYQDLIARYGQFDPEAHKTLETKSNVLRKLFGRDGRHAASFEEFASVAHEILPSSLLSDIRKLSNYILQESTTTSEDDSENQYITDSFTDNIKRLSPFWTFSQVQWKENIPIDPVHFAAVTVATALSRTTVAPLERLKILMQLQKVHGYPTENNHFRRFRQGFAQMIAEEKVRGMFRGNGANVLRVVPATMIQLSCLQMFTKYYEMREK
eukprot:jgi/Galph1/1683/GphlegSOOS_G394.1